MLASAERGVDHIFRQDVVVVVLAGVRRPMRIQGLRVQGKPTPRKGVCGKRKFFERMERCHDN